MCYILLFCNYVYAIVFSVFIFCFFHLFRNESSLFPLPPDNIIYILLLNQFGDTINYVFFCNLLNESLTTLSIFFLIFILIFKLLLDSLFVEMSI